jgi:hypothetical protein
MTVGAQWDHGTGAGRDECARGPTTRTSSSSRRSWPRSPSGSAYPLHADDRVRFAIVEGHGATDDAPARREPSPPAWIDTITTNDEHLAERSRAVIRA